MRHNKRHNVQSNPNIASSTDELKANYAREAVIPPEANRDKSHRLGHAPAIGGVVLTALIAAGGVLGYNKMSSDTTPAPDRGNEPNASAPVTPGEKEIRTTDYTPTELAVERYQDGDALVRAYKAEYNKWVMSGVDIQDTVDWANSEESIDNIGEEYDNKYIASLFVDDWQERPQLVESINSIKEVHGAVLNTSIMTTDSTQPEDKEPYEQRDKITSIQIHETSDNKIVASYRFVMESNADMNRGDLYVDNVNGTTGGRTVTFIDDNGTWKISDMKYFAG